MKKYAQQGTPSLFGVGEPSPLGDSHPRTGQLPAGGPRYRTTTLSHRPPSEQGQFWKWPLFCRIQEMGGGVALKDPFLLALVERTWVPRSFLRGQVSWGNAPTRKIDTERTCINIMGKTFK